MAYLVAQRLGILWCGRVRVTGETGDDEVREQAVAALAESERRVLVATGCLSDPKAVERFVLDAASTSVPKAD